VTASRRPSFTELVDWVEHRLPAQRAADVAAHVDADAQLQDGVAWIRRFLVTAAEAPLVEPPAKLRAALRAVFREGGRASGTSLSNRLVLLFDSRRDHATSGVRGIDSDIGVHLAYAGDIVDLVVDVYPEVGTTARLEGQLLLHDAQPAPPIVTIRGADGEVTDLTVDDPLGRFAVDGVRAGPTELHVRLAAIELCVDLDLSSPPDEL
jgi:hypothetical protein